MKNFQAICVFGDSTSWGGWDTEKGGWVSRLWLHVSQTQNHITCPEIYNLSISGGTTQTILDRFENETRIRKADALIFQTSGNDASYENSPDQLLVSPDQFKQNIQEIIDRAKKITPNIIFTDVKNCDESKTMPWDGVYYANSNISKYVLMMKEICDKNGVLYCDIKPLDNGDFFDGLHPNEKGHEKIFVQVRDFLTQQGWI